MFKVIALLKKKDGLSRQQFIEYYENNHAPFIFSLFPFIALYQRKYVDLRNAIFYPGAGPVGFDVITEMGFTDQADYHRMMKMFDDKSISDRIAEDEEHFLNRDQTRFFVIEERTI